MINYHTNKILKCELLTMNCMLHGQNRQLTKIDLVTKDLAVDAIDLRCQDFLRY